MLILALNLNRVALQLCQMVAVVLDNALRSLEVGFAVLAVLLEAGLDLGLMESEVVDGADAEDTEALEAAAPAVHQRTTVGAEEVGHRVPGRDRFGGRVLR